MGEADRARWARLDRDALFWAKVNKTETCWLWTAKCSGRDPYGTVRRFGRLLMAHRVAYELVKGPIPDGLQLDHLCRVTQCVNPDHLEPVTNRENALRGTGVAARNAAKTTCKRGHSFDSTDRGGRRLCTVCSVSGHRERRARRRLAGLRVT